MLEHFSWVHGLWLFGAIALEILANVLLKMSNGFKRLWLGSAAILCVLGAFTCLSFAVKGIPLSVAYALWGSFGIIITVIMGMVLFQQRVNRKGWVGLSMLVLSIVLIKMA